MPRLLSKVSGNNLPKEVSYNHEFYSFKETGEEKQLELLPNDCTKWKNGFYKTSKGDKVFVFDREPYSGTRYMPAWVYYNFCTNFKSRKMNGKQYDCWWAKMENEAKKWLLYDYD